MLTPRRPEGMASPLLELRDVVKHFPFPGRPFRRRRLVAVAGVTLSIPHGETLGLVGESGSGKTTLGRLALRLIEPTSGTIRFDGTDLLALSEKALRGMRRRMQTVFQDATLSLNPRLTVGTTLGEPLAIHRLAPRQDIRRRAGALLAEVGLDASLLDHYPHELSGGQRQRVGIARALSVEPEFVVLDEPVSSLDVSVAAQVLNLLADLQRRRHLTYLLIAHDLAVVRHLADRVAVMYLGRIVELSPALPLYAEPRHPYTASLLSAVPVPDPTAQRQRIVLPGEMPSATQLPAGCPFHPRCPHPSKTERCRRELPPLREVTPGRWAACHFAEIPLSAPPSVEPTDQRKSVEPSA